MQLVDGVAKFDTDLCIFFVREVPMLIFSEVVTVEAALKGEGVRDHELFPCHDTSGTEFVGLNLEPAIFVVKEMRLLREDPWKKTNDSPTQESSVGSRVASIEEAVLLFGMPMEITINPELSPFFFTHGFENLLDAIDFRLKLFIRLDPLAIEVNTRG